MHTYSPWANRTELLQGKTVCHAYLFIYLKKRQLLNKRALIISGFLVFFFSFLFAGGWGGGGVGLKSCFLLIKLYILSEKNIHKRGFKSDCSILKWL